MYRLAVPHADLLPFVEHYWAVSAAPGEVVDLSVDVYVDARADLIFNFGGPYLRGIAGRRPVRHAVSNLDAQRTLPIRIVQRGAVATVGVRFRVGGLAPFLGRPVSAYTNRTPGLPEVFGSAGTQLEKSLSRRRTDIGEQGKLLDAFFRERMVVDEPYLAFSSVKKVMEDGGGLVAVDEIARAEGVSPRNLGRLFGRFLGISPKLYARIVRFQKALRLLMNDEKTQLGTVSAECGYFDQSHFIRDFREFTGGVPRGYKGNYPPKAPADFAPNVVRFIQDEGNRPPHLSWYEEDAMAKAAKPKGARDDPWLLKTPPGTSAYSMYRDDEADPPVLVCQVGTTTLKYQARAIEDLHAMLKKAGDWVPLGSADEGKPAEPGTVEEWGRSPKNPVKGWYGLKKGLRGRFGMYLPPLLEALGLAELEHNPRGNRMRAK